MEDKISSLENTVKSLEQNSRVLANQYSVAIETVRSLKEVLLMGMRPIGRKIEEKPTLEESGRYLSEEWCVMEEE
ncbi:MAG: hypothetical protein DRO36_06145 [Candidatus Hecatellales archaeon]|nr:MAG: hypothetical protein DRO36_06145 [Candidatus Hecatellales archaeon]